MKKLFFFKSSSDKHIVREKESETSDGHHHALRRSRSLSSAAFLVDATSSSYDPNATGTSRHRTHSSSRFKCFKPESQGEHMYNDSSPSFSSTCSSTQVLDRFIDVEELHHSTQKIASSSYNHVKGRKLPPRVHSPLSDHVIDKLQCNNGMEDSSPPSLSTSLIERLSHGGKSKGSKDLDVFSNLVPLSEHKELMNGYYTNDQQELEKKYKEEIRRVKTDYELHIKRLEKEKSELQSELEREIDRRSTEWTSKLESFKMEEKRLRERVRELAEHNVSLQREVSTFHEKETDRIDMVRNMEEKVNELSATAEAMSQENVYLKQSLSKLQESYSGQTEDLDCVRRNFEEKEMECKTLHKSVTRLVRTCGEQEKTIQGLRDTLSDEKHEEMEQIRLTGVEFSLRKEVESTKLEADSLRVENVCLAKGNGADSKTTTFKLDNEMKMRVCFLQDQGLLMLNESTQVCYKLLKFIKEKVSQDMGNGLSEQFLIESEMDVHGIRRGAESLKRSLQTVNGLLLEKTNEIALNSEPNNQSVEKLLRSELRAETLVTSLLKEKLYSKEQEIEQLQAEVAASVRGNEVLQRGIQNVLDNLSLNTHQLQDLKIQMVKKDENVKRLETNLQEAARQLASMKVTLPKVLEERDEMCKRNMDLESEKEMLKKEVERLEEDTLLKEGEITILKDTLGSKHFDLLSSPDFAYNEFLVQ